MANQRLFYLCSKCGNLIDSIHGGGGELTCCGQPMDILSPNTTDAATEKHVPLLHRDGARLIVTVGSAAHPMQSEHHIAWIAVAAGAFTARVALSPDAPPTAEFTLPSTSAITVYAYCNLHGLWSAEG